MEIPAVAVLYHAERTSCMKPTLVVMAAGMGSRYGGIKQIDPVGLAGEAILDYSIFDALRAGFGKIVFIIRKDIEKDVKDFFGDRFEKRIPTFFVHQEKSLLPPGFTVPEGRVKPWGTGHAVLCVRSVVDDPFAVINADDFYGKDAFKVMADYLVGINPGEPAFSMVGYRLKNTLSENGSVSRGVCDLDSEGFLKAVEEHLKIERTPRGVESLDPDHRRLLTGNETISMNLFGFTPVLFPLLEREFKTFLTANGKDLKAECYIPKVVNSLISSGEGRVKVLNSSASWFGITYKEDKVAVQENIRRLIKAGEYPERLW